MPPFCIKKYLTLQYNLEWAIDPRLLFIIDIITHQPPGVWGSATPATLLPSSPSLIITHKNNGSNTKHTRDHQFTRESTAGGIRIVNGIAKNVRNRRRGCSSMPFLNSLFYNHRDRNRHSHRHRATVREVINVLRRSQMFRFIKMGELK